MKLNLLSFLFGFIAFPICVIIILVIKIYLRELKWNKEYLGYFIFPKKENKRK